MKQFYLAKRSEQRKPFKNLKSYKTAEASSVSFAGILRPACKFTLLEHNYAADGVNDKMVP